MSEKQKEYDELHSENKKLLLQVGDLQKKIDKMSWERKNVTNEETTLVMGSSLIKHLDDKKLVNTKVISKPGAHINDIKDALEEIPLNSYDHIVIVAGGNDLTNTDPDQVLEKYKESVSVAKDICPQVTMSGLPPRTKPELLPRL